MLSTPLEEIEKRARLWAQALDSSARIIEGESMIGGGSLPGGTLPTRLLALGGQGKRKNKDLAQAIAQRLRCQEPPIVGRISGNLLLLDPRSVLPEEDETVLKALCSVIADLEHPY
jgi:L-seryl-tRNA(Ser) seleniumtransferase